MIRSSRPLPLLLLAATAALVVAFYFQTRLMDVDRHNAVSQDILTLKQLDTHLNEQTLKAVSLQLIQYDSLVSTVNRMKMLDKRLNAPSTGLYDHVGPGVNKQLKIYTSLMLAKIDIVESIKSHTAIVRNTLSYLPLEIERVTKGRHEPEVMDIHRLLSAVLQHNLSPSENTRANVLAIMNTLRSANLKAVDRAAVDNALMHVRANLKANEAISKDIEKFIQFPTIRALDLLFEAHTEFSTARIKEANLYRIVLLVLSLVLFAGLAFALLRLRNAHDLAERTSRQFRDAAESIGEGFAFFDAKGRLSFWNATFERLHQGVGESLHTGIKFDTFYKACVEAGVYKDVIMDDAKNHDTGGRARGHPYVVKSSGDIWMLASDSRMADGGTASVRVDISDSKHAEEELRKLSRAVEQSPVSVMITDTDGYITYVNPKFEDATGYAAAEVIGQRPGLISSGEKSASQYSELWKTISNGGEWNGEFHNKRKDGTLFWEYSSISPIKNERGEITSYLAVKEDITDRKRALSELLKAKEQAEQASHAKTQFLANMSHELRTPLNAIIGFSEIIQGQMFGPLGNKNYVDYSTNILSSGQHLLGVINDILDISRIEIGTMDLHEEVMDFTALCQNCLGMVQPQADLAKLILSAHLQDGLPFLHADVIRIKQIILNLLSNAVKFTPQGGKIDLIARQEDSGAISLIIRDTGYGIPQDKQQQILEPFEQVSDIYTRNHEGSGMGLFLVSSFVKLHGGSLDIDSTVDTGTTITITFPIDRTITA